jgi:hypothetical protein
MLIDVMDALLQAAVASINLLTESRLHALHLVEHHPEVHLHGIVIFATAGVVVGVGFHGSVV